MIRTEYLETTEGQAGAHRRRSRRRQNFDIRRHEPKSKNSMNPKDAIAFQDAISTQMVELRRLAYRSSVVLEIDFYSHQNDPPAIHTLAKNYMDLLQSPVVGSAITRDKILLKDDRNIDVLIVNYHLRETPHPQIHIQVDTLANFRSDLALIDRIRHRRFADSSDYDIDEVVGNDPSYYSENDLGDAVREYREWQLGRTNIERRYGEAAFSGMDRMNRLRVQEAYLELYAPKTSQLILMLPAIQTGTIIAPALVSSVRQMITSPPLMIDLTHPPVEGAGKDVFKSNAGSALEKFKSDNNLLFPLLTSISVTILCVPPEDQTSPGQERYVDLDNLARYIIPAVHQIFDPPSDTIHTFDTSTIEDDRLRIHFEERLASLKRTPKTSIVQYQMIRMPRSADDPKNGFVRLAIGKGQRHDGLWRQMDGIISRWHDSR